jgi:hypothetical protein
MEFWTLIGAELIGVISLANAVSAFKATRRFPLDQKAVLELFNLWWGRDGLWHRDWCSSLHKITWLIFSLSAILNELRTTPSKGLLLRPTCYMSVQCDVFLQRIQQKKQHAIVWTSLEYNGNKRTPWLWSASELHRPSDHRLLAK